MEEPALRPRDAGWPDPAGAARSRRSSTAPGAINADALRVIDELLDQIADSGRR